MTRRKLAAQHDARVRELRAKLDAAEDEAQVAARQAEELADTLAERDEDVLRVEALAELGEHDPKDAEKRARDLERARVAASEAERDARRKRYAVEHLSERLAEAEREAIEARRAGLTTARGDAARLAAERLRETMRCVDALDRAEFAFREAGLQPPHSESIVYQDLLTRPDRARARRHGDAAHTAGLGGEQRQPGRGAHWLQTLEKLGYLDGER